MALTFGPWTKSFPGYMLATFKITSNAYVSYIVGLKIANMTSILFWNLITDHTKVDNFRNVKFDNSTEIYTSSRFSL